MIVGSLTGAAAHELNNILGILGLRLEKIQEDLGASPRPAQDDPAGDDAARKDLAVMERNLERAVALVGHLQWLMRAGGDVGRCAAPEDFQRAILDAIEVQQAIYERKSSLEHQISLANIRPVSRGHFHLFLVAALQRVVVDLGRGATLRVVWSQEVAAETDADRPGALLEILGEAPGVDSGLAPSASPGGADAVLELLADQTEALAAGLAPDQFQSEDFSYICESEGGPAAGRRVRLSLRLPG